MKLYEIESLLEQFAPLQLALEYDHVGLQVGDPDEEIHKVLVSLDLTEAVAKEAVDKKVDLIITHHPLFFDPAFSITTRTARGRIVSTLIESKIAYYAAHTNMDIAKGGINDYLCELIGLTDCAVLEPVSETDGLGRIGKLPESMSQTDFLIHIQQALNNEVLRYVGNKAKISTVAICSGSGASMLDTAIEKGADALLTGDLKYSNAQQTEGKPILLVDAGHFGTETFFCEIIHGILEGAVSVETALANQDYIKSLTI